MALQRDYEIPGTGVVVANAYHVITSVHTEKRAWDIPSPPDHRSENGVTPRDTNPKKEVYWKEGYIGYINVTVWKDAQAKIDHKQPIGFLGVSPAENIYGASIGTPGKEHICMFRIDLDSELDTYAQAYEHLLDTEYYADAVTA
jgi:hypothetical protein